MQLELRTTRQELAAEIAVALAAGDGSDAIAKRLAERFTATRKLRPSFAIETVVGTPSTLDISLGPLVIQSMRSSMLGSVIQLNGIAPPVKSCMVWGDMDGDRLWHCAIHQALLVL
jgi:hypothetical protein